jgi:base plate protein
MSLPKLKHPLHAFVVPSTKKKVSFRPLLVREEKLLLMAKESEVSEDIFVAIKQVINNCCIEKGFDVDDLTLFDMETLYMKLYSVSINNVISVTYVDKEDKQSYSFDVDLGKVEIKWPDKEVSKVIPIDSETGLTMRYPKANLYNDKDFLKTDKDSFFELIVRCVESVYTKTEVLPASDYTEAEIKEFLSDLDVKTYQRVSSFMLNQPSLYYELKYKNAMEHERRIELTTLSDFFSLR